MELLYHMNSKSVYLLHKHLHYYSTCLCSSYPLLLKACTCESEIEYFSYPKTISSVKLMLFNSLCMTHNAFMCFILFIFSCTHRYFDSLRFIISLNRSSYITYVNCFRNSVTVFQYNQKIYFSN